MSNLSCIAYCGVNCAACPDFTAGKCPGCRQTVWGDDPCMPVRCCGEKGILHCGDCPTFPCEDMRAFFEESEGHKEAYARLLKLREESADR